MFRIYADIEGRRKRQAHNDEGKSAVRILKRPDGTQLAYDDAGSGPCAVFLHGWSQDRFSFEPQKRALAGHVRFIALDQRGHGDSFTPATASRATLAHLRDDLMMLFEELSLENCTLVGWSMGAMVAWMAADAGLSSRLQGIVSVDMSPFVGHAEDWAGGLALGDPEHLAFDHDKTGNAGWHDYIAAFTSRVLAKGSTNTELIDTLQDAARRADPAGAASLWQSLISMDLRDAVAQLDVPLLAAYGCRSQFFSEAASAFLEVTAPHARRIAFEASGHAPHLEEPDRFNALLSEFIADPKATINATVNVLEETHV